MTDDQILLAAAKAANLAMLGDLAALIATVEAKGVPNAETLIYTCQHIARHAADAAQAAANEARTK